MWQVHVNGSITDQWFDPQITKMEVELECRILYGLQAKLDIKWIDLKKEHHDESHPHKNTV